MADFDVLNQSSVVDGFSECDYVPERSAIVIQQTIDSGVRAAIYLADDASTNFIEVSSGVRNDTLTGSTGSSILKLVVSKFYQGFE